MVRFTYKLRLRLSRFLIASSSNIFRESGAFLCFSNVQKITSEIFLLQFMFRSIAKNLTKEPCKDVVFTLMCSMYFIT